MSAYILATLMGRLGACGPGTRVIEIGSGTGYLGMALSLSGAQVLLTDVEEQIPLLESNVNLNESILGSGGQVRVAHLDWGRSLSDSITSQTFDIIVGSECLYEDEHVEQVLGTVNNLMINCSAKYFYYGMQLDRMGADKYFSELKSLASSFPFDLRVRSIHPTSVVGAKNVDALSAESLRRNALHFLVFEKKLATVE